MKWIYLDNAAATRPAPPVLAVMATTASELYANPSAAHAGGAEAARALEGARQQVAAAVGGQSSEIVFTGGGTEANALAILGAPRRPQRRHIVVSALEHPSVSKNVDRLVATADCELSVVPADALGMIRPEAVAAAVRPDTALVCVMHVNNELGTLQPVTDISRVLQAGAARTGARRPPHLHVDAIQSLGHVRFRVATLGADSVSFSAHKLHGPKGVGALWLRAGVRLQTRWDGGGQERGLRSGTENLAGVMGFGCAARLAVESLSAGDGARMGGLRDRFEADAMAAVAGLRLTVASADRAPHISSLSLPDLSAEPLLHALEARGVLASAGSACASREKAMSPVLEAIGCDENTAVLRFSLSRETTSEELGAAVTALADAVASLRPTRRWA